MLDENIIFSKFPEVRLGNVLLREIVLDDVDDFYDYITSKEVTKYLSDSEIPSSRESAKAELMYWANLYKRRVSIYWAICDARTGRLIGTAGFNSWSREHKRAEISYDLSAQYWNKGIMTKVVSEITKFGLEVLKVNRLQATVVTFNDASARVLEKCNYKKEGELENFGILHGKSENFYMYSFSKE